MSLIWKVFAECFLVSWWIGYLHGENYVHLVRYPDILYIERHP